MSGIPDNTLPPVLPSATPRPQTQHPLEPSIFPYASTWPFQMVFRTPDVARINVTLLQLSKQLGPSAGPQGHLRACREVEDTLYLANPLPPGIALVAGILHRHGSTTQARERSAWIHPTSAWMLCWQLSQMRSWSLLTTAEDTKVQRG